MKKTKILLRGSLLFSFLGVFLWNLSAASNGVDIGSTPPEESVVQPQALQWPSDKLIVKNPVKNKNGQTVPVYGNPSIKNVTVDGKEDNDGGYLYFSDNSDSDLSHVDEDTTYCPRDLMLTNSPGFYTKMT